MQKTENLFLITLSWSLTFNQQKILIENPNRIFLENRDPWQCHDDTQQKAHQQKAPIVASVNWAKIRGIEKSVPPIYRRNDKVALVSQGFGSEDSRVREQECKKAGIPFIPSPNKQRKTLPYKLPNLGGKNTDVIMGKLHHQMPEPNQRRREEKSRAPIDYNKGNGAFCMKFQLQHEALRQKEIKQQSPSTNSCRTTTCSCTNKCFSLGNRNYVAPTGQNPAVRQNVA